MRLPWRSSVMRAQAMFMRAACLLMLAACGAAAQSDLPSVIAGMDAAATKFTSVTGDID